jgi:hypothetical protein
VKKLLVLLLIAFVGAGIAYGAASALFSGGAKPAPVSEPRGLVDEVPAVRIKASPKPSPTAGAAAIESSSSGTGTPSAVAVSPEAESGRGPRMPRTPRSAGGEASDTTSTHVEQGVVTHPSTGEEDDCDSISDHEDREKCREREDKDK